jgi:hypothetical protein
VARAAIGRASVDATTAGTIQDNLRFGPSRAPSSSGLRLPPASRAEEGLAQDGIVLTLNAGSFGSAQAAAKWPNVTSRFQIAEPHRRPSRVANRRNPSPVNLWWKLVASEVGETSDSGWNEGCFPTEAIANRHDPVE